MNANGGGLNCFAAADLMAEYAMVIAISDGIGTCLAIARYIEGQHPKNTTGKAESGWWVETQG
jgi:hypothetical protein